MFGFLFDARRIAEETSSVIVPFLQASGQLQMFETPIGQLYTIFYDNLFVANPALRPLFKSSLQVQGRKLVSMLGTIVSMAKKGDLEQLKTACEKLGERHVGYNVALVHFHTVGQVLLATLAECLGDDFTPELRGAWLNTFCILMKFIMPAHKAAFARRQKELGRSKGSVLPAHTAASALIDSTAQAPAPAVGEAAAATASLPSINSASAPHTSAATTGGAPVNTTSGANSPPPPAAAALGESHMPTAEAATTSTP